MIGLVGKCRARHSSRTAPAQSAPLIVNLAVAPPRQGQGLGSRLLAHAEVVARAEGKPLLRLYTNRLMTPNIALYKSRGYAIDREEAYALGGVTVHMSKPVPADILVASKSPR
jgi:ribosomal protein S18 acetylase RimI-like enzyme